MPDSRTSRAVPKQSRKHPQTLVVTSVTTAPDPDEHVATASPPPVSPAIGNLTPVVSTTASGTTSTSSSTSTVSTTATPPTSTPSVVDAPPENSVPTPPPGFVDIDGKEFYGLHPKTAQVAVAPVVVAELTSSTDYESRFGATAPAAQTVANALEIAYQWRLVRTATEAWSRYVGTEDGLAWKNALTLLAQLEPLFDAAVVRDPSVATEYPGLVRFFDSPSVVARKAAATKKKAAKAKAQEAVTTAVNAAVGAALTHAAEEGGAGQAAATTAATGKAATATV